MKLEAFSEVSNLVRHLEGLEARKTQIEDAREQGTDSYVIELRQRDASHADIGATYSCLAYMQAHDADAPFTVEQLFGALLAQLATRIEGVKAKLRDLGVNLDDNPHAELDKRIDRVMSRKAHDLQNTESPSKEKLSGDAGKYRESLGET